MDNFKRIPRGGAVPSRSVPSRGPVAQRRPQQPMQSAPQPQSTPQFQTQAQPQPATPHGVPPKVQNVGTPVESIVPHQPLPTTETASPAPIEGFRSEQPPQQQDRESLPGSPEQQSPMNEVPASVPQPIAATDSATGLKPQKKRRKSVLAWVVGLIVFLVASVLGVYGWYNLQLAPVDQGNDAKVQFIVKPGSSTSMIAEELKAQDLIRNALAFTAYAKVNSSLGALKSGSYQLSQSESIPEIYSHLLKGTSETFDITFLPGGTVMDNKKVLQAAGYSDAEIDEAFMAQYDLPLMEGREPGQDLEGYIWGDTYRMGVGASVKDILMVAFNEYDAFIKENDLEKGFAEQGLTLKEGITLASIIQRESGNGKDDAQIAQVFYTRIKMGMMLGSDVTYQYIADKEGVERRIDLDSPYNTRRYTGLPPAPIATPGVDALKAVANPAPGDYLYFLSGDDDVTYFGRTLQEHERNIVDHCAKKCQII